MVKSGHTHKQAVAAAMRTARRYAEGGDVEEEKPRSLFDYNAKPEPIAAYPEMEMKPVVKGELGSPDSYVAMEPHPFDISSYDRPKQAQTGIQERVKEGWKTNFGKEDVGISQENLQKYPFLYQYQPFARPVDAAMRAVPGAVGAAGGFLGGLWEKATGDKAGADKLQRDAYIVGQYPGTVPHHMPGAGAAAATKTRGVINTASAVADAGIKSMPENSLGVFGAPMKIKPSSTLDLDPKEFQQYKQIGPQLGSNSGGTYEAPDGSKHYVKFPKTDDHARNEKLAGELYKLTNVSVPDLKLSRKGGKDIIVSPIMEGKPLYSVVSDYGMRHHKGMLTPGLQENFPVDAWLGNYDVVGTGKDNVVIGQDGNAHRIDLGGSLRYRAQGKLKDYFGPEVKELESMIDPNTNWDAYEVFGATPKEKMTPAAQRIANVTDDQIRELVQKYGPIHQSQKALDTLANNLIARRDYIAEKFGVKPGGDAGGTPPKPNLSDLTDEQIILKHPDLYGQQMLDKFNGDPQKIASDLFDIANAYGYQTADKIITSTPEFNPILGDLDANLSDLAKRHGHDPWSKTSFDDLEQRPFTKEDADNYNEPKDYTDSEIESYYAKQYDDEITQNSLASGEIKSTGSLEDVRKLLSPLKDSDDLWKDLTVHHGDEVVPIKLTPEQDKAISEFMPKGYKMLPITLWKGGEPTGLTRTDHYTYSFKEDKFTPSGVASDIEEIKKYVPKNQYLNEVPDPNLSFGEQAFFMGSVMRVAHGYSENAQPFIGFAKNPASIDWYAAFNEYSYSGYKMMRVIEAAKKSGHDVVIINNIFDNMYGAGWGQNLHSQILFLDTVGRVKSPHAEMKDWGSRLVHTGLAGVGIIGGGMFIDPKTAEAKESEVEKKASGGAVNGYTKPIRMKSGGMLNSSIPGRTDKIPVNVPAGAYVLPADVPSALGQGNSMAGGEILKKMFTSGPYGMAAPKPKGGSRQMRWMQPPRPFRAPRAEGGSAEGTEEIEDQRVPIIAAGGEYIIHPDVVLSVGEGSMKRGHDILDKFVLDVRRKHIHTLKKLKPPKR